MAPSAPSRRRLSLAICLSLFTALVLAASPVTAKTDNAGTIKVHNPNDLGDPNNDPHVGCPFYVEGFNMEALSGDLTIKSWPPTGNKTVVLSDTWSATDPLSEDGHHFLNGPYNLTDGHYKVFVSDTHHDKMKVFWVDCTPPCNPQQDCNPCASSQEDCPCAESQEDCPCAEAQQDCNPCTNESPLAVVTDFHYVVNGNDFDSLDGNVGPGDEVTVVFTLTGCGSRELSFVSYNTTSDHNLPDQTVFSSDTGTFDAGEHTLDIVIPPCFFQVDFVYGAVIEHFDPDHGVTYHDQERFIDGIQGGEACETQTTTTTTTTSSTTSTTTTEIPFFPSAAAVMVGLVGAVGGSLYMLRRRL